MVYKIVIEDKTSNSYNPVAGQESSSESQNENTKQSVSKKDFGFYVAYRQAKPFISQVVSNDVQKIGLRTGSNRLQEKANFYFSIASKTFNLAESVAIGAKVGGWVGALAGAVLNGVHTAITYANNVSKLEIEKSIEDESRRMNLIRAGTSGSRRG